jgi:hypothetical protein
MRWICGRIASRIATPGVRSVRAELHMGRRAVIDLVAQRLEDEGTEVEIRSVGSTPASRCAGVDRALLRVGGF